MDHTIYHNSHLHSEVRAVASSVHAGVFADGDSGLVVADSRRTVPVVGTSPIEAADDVRAGGAAGRACVVEAAVAAAEAAGRSRISVGPGSQVRARAAACSRVAESAMIAESESRVDCTCRTGAA